MIDELPSITWIKFDLEKHKYYEDGSRFLVALRVQGPTKTQWEFEVITVKCDEDWMCLEYGGGETYDAWDFSDFEYFHILDGREPSEEP